MKSVIERFEEKFTKAGEDECWLWKAYTDRAGYGTFRLNGEKRRAHRISYLLYKGEFNGDLFVLHSCDVPGCVNPKHLSIGTAQDNSDDTGRRNRRAFGEKLSLSKKPIRKDGMKISRLTNEIAAKIKSDGRRVSIVAQEFGVSLSTVTHIRSGRIWKSLA